MVLIHQMTHEECISTLARLRFGRLGCARDNQPYVVPIYFTYHERHLYTFSMTGQKIEWMRENPRVCVEADEVTSHNQWLSVVVVGHYEELPDTPEYKSDRNLAYELFQEHAMWWEPVEFASPHHDAADSLTPIYYCIYIDQVTGHRAMPDSVETAASHASQAAKKSESWLSRLLHAHGSSSGPGRHLL